MAQGGTLFLDEIANISPMVQMKLLRSLQERQIMPLGSEKNVPTDVRIIVASNAILEEEVSAGRFRTDLFHRLNEFKLYLLPLRQRREDILFLADRFRQETNTELRKNVVSFSPEAQAFLLTHDWLGNVRELRNAVRRAVLLSTENIELKHIRQGLSSTMPSVEHTMFPKVQPEYGLYDIVHEVESYLEKSLIEHALQETRGNKTQAAKRLKIGYKTLYRKLQEYKITQ
jgi:DNA-binding NtrC family response regulator